MGQLLDLMAGRLVLIKSVIEAIPVYWMELAYITKKMLNNINKLCLHYIWLGKQDDAHIFIVKWDMISCPKIDGGWE